MPFDKPLTLWADDVTDDILKQTQRTALGIQRDVVLGMPVDVGTARGSVHISVGRISNADVRSEDPSGSNTLAKGASEISTAKPFQIIAIQSSLVYMGRLEDGHSPQNKGFWAMAFANAKLRLSGGR